MLTLFRRLLVGCPAACTGVDFNVFNVLLEGQLKRSGAESQARGDEVAGYEQRTAPRSAAW